MFRAKAFSSLLLILMGSMDCVTTVVGILYFGAVELNPFLAGIINANLSAFIALKLATTVFITLIFRQAERVLLQTKAKNSRAFAWARNLLRLAYVGLVLFLLIVVVNNVLVLVKAL